MNNDIVEALKQLIEMILTESEKLSEDFEKHDFADVEKSYIITNKLNILTETLNDFKNAHTNEDLLKAATKTKEKLLKLNILN